MSALIATVGVVLVGCADAAPQPSGEKAGDKVYVRMTTSLGSMIIELNQEKAPITVKNFLDYADAGFYEGTIFHRVIKDFMAQGGGMTPDYVEKPSKQPIKNEADNGLKNTYGTLAMARTGDPHSATSQFFINCRDNGFLNHTGKTQRGWGYCVFGRVVAGKDTLEKIRNTKVKRDVRADRQSPAMPITPVVIQKVSRVDNDDPDAAKARAAAEVESAKRAKEMQAITGKAKAFIKQRGADPSKGITHENGLWILTVKVGNGPSPAKTDRVKVHYTGWLVNGKKFDSSVDRGEPITFPLDGVIKGWTEGVSQMKVGGKCYLVIPPEMAYGDQNIGNGLIPPGSTLIFEVDLLAIE